MSEAKPSSGSSDQTLKICKLSRFRNIVNGTCDLTLLAHCDYINTIKYYQTDGLFLVQVIIH